MGAELQSPRCLPGTSVRALLATSISPRTLERVFDPIFADLHAEWLAAESRFAATRAYCLAHVAILRAATRLLTLRASHALGESTLRFGLHIALAAALTFAVFLILASIVTSPDPDLPRSRPDPELSDFHRSPRGEPTPGRVP